MPTLDVRYALPCVAMLCTYAIHLSTFVSLYTTESIPSDNKLPRCLKVRLVCIVSVPFRLNRNTHDTLQTLSSSMSVDNTCKRTTSISLLTATGCGLVYYTFWWKAMPCPRSAVGRPSRPPSRTCCEQKVLFRRAYWGVFEKNFDQRVAATRTLTGIH